MGDRDAGGWGVGRWVGGGRGFLQLRCKVLKCSFHVFSEDIDPYSRGRRIAQTNTHSSNCLIFKTRAFKNTISILFF